MEVEMPV